MNIYASTKDPPTNNCLNWNHQLTDASKNTSNSLKSFSSTKYPPTVNHPNWSHQLTDASKRALRPMKPTASTLDSYSDKHTKVNCGDADVQPAINKLKIKTSSTI